MRRMDRKGIALVISLMVLLALTALGTALMVITVSETRQEGAYKWYLSALQVAEAGFCEAIQRLRLPESDPLYIGETGTLNPNWMAIILLTDDLPANIGDTVFYSSAQITNGVSPVLLYSAESFNNSTEDIVLKVYYKHEGNSIWFYDERHQREVLGDPSLGDMYYPIYVIEVTGRSGLSRRKIIAEVVKRQISVNIPGGLAAANAYFVAKGQRDIAVCGHVHKESTPWGTYASDTDPGGSHHYCYEQDASGNELYHVRRKDGTPHPVDNPEVNPECAEAGCIPGIVTTSWSLRAGNRSDFDAYGNPDVLIDPDYTTPEIWEILGFESEAAMLSEIDWLTDPSASEYTYTSPTAADTASPKFVHITPALANRTVRVMDPDNPAGVIIDSVYYLPGGRYGKGVLWIEGSAHIRNGGFKWKGLIYVEHHLITPKQGSPGAFWVLGSVCVKGDIYPEHGGGGAGIKPIQVLYCPRTIDNSINVEAGSFHILKWREVR